MGLFRARKEQKMKNVPKKFSKIEKHTQRDRRADARSRRVQRLQLHQAPPLDPLSRRLGTVPAFPIRRHSSPQF